MCPAPSRLSLLDVWAPIVVFLAEPERAHLSGIFGCDVQSAPMWLTRPWAPIRRRIWGFGRISRARSTVSDDPNLLMIIHHTWTFLDTSARTAVRRASHRIDRYSKFRLLACSLSLGILRHAKGHPPRSPAHLSGDTAARFGTALLRFDFVYGDLIRWLGGEYTNRSRSWSSIFRKLAEPGIYPAPSSLPVPDLARGFHICTEGVPLQGSFTSPAAEIPVRDRYDNHPGIALHHAEVERKFAKEEEKTFHLLLPRFFCYFIPGLFLSPLEWAIRKGVGRICVDGTNGPSKTGSPNSYIPKPSESNADECPPVFYGTAFNRHLEHLWRMRITRPRENILQHCDDIEAAFWRVLYHPNLAIVFAYLFGNFLLIPVGQVFGSRSAPSYFSLLSDIRAYAAATANLSPSRRGYSALVQSCQINPLPEDWDPEEHLAPAVVDSINQPYSDTNRPLGSHSTFVDDNGVASYRSETRQVLEQSIQSAYILFGRPGEDRRGSCFAIDKWDLRVGVIMMYLGFLIDSRRLLVTWPKPKRDELVVLILAVIANPRQVLPKVVASILGKLRSASRLAPWGVYMTFSIQEALTLALRRAYGSSKNFWKNGRLRLTKNVLADLAIICVVLGRPEWDPTWTQPIGLLIRRDPTRQFHSDASHGGIGGWSLTHQLMWRVMYEDLVQLGFSMKAISLMGEPLDPTAEGLHINPLEFIAVIINLWLGLKMLEADPASATGEIIALFSDNTTANSWLRYCSKVPDPRLRALARVASLLLTRASLLNTRFQSFHIPGLTNVEADYLSRLIRGLAPSWDSVMRDNSRLATCQICLLPRELLSQLAELISSPPSADMYETITTSLLALEPSILPAGSIPTDSISSLQDA